MIYVFKRGLSGVALSTSIAIITGGMIAAVYILFYARQLKFKLRPILENHIKDVVKSIVYQCRIGSSSLLGELMLAILAFIGNYVFMRYLGDNGVGAFGIACYYTPFIFMIANAVIQSAQPIISYNHFAHNLDRVHKIRRMLFATALAAGVFLTLVFLFLPEILVHFFVGETDPAAPIAINGFPYFAVGILFFMFNVCIVGYFQSLELMKPALTLMFLRGFLLLIPAFILLPNLIGISGIWLAMPLSETLTFIVGIILFSKAKRTNT